MFGRHVTHHNIGEAQLSKRREFRRHGFHRPGQNRFFRKASIALIDHALLKTLRFGRIVAYENIATDRDGPRLTIKLSAGLAILIQLLRRADAI